MLVMIACLIYKRNEEMMWPLACFGMLCVDKWYERLMGMNAAWEVTSVLDLTQPLMQ